MGYPHKPHAARDAGSLQVFRRAGRASRSTGGRSAAVTLRSRMRCSMSPARSSTIVKESGLRGRGGAGFPTGVKWSFMKPGDGKPHYLCCNADESEPGTFKDREIMRWTPHAPRRGVSRSARTRSAPRRRYIYIRGEFTEPHCPRRGVRSRKRTRRGSWARTPWASGKTINIYVHRGAGAYICGEETALMNSIEGRRGNPRIKPPFPAVAGVVRPADDDQQRRDARRSAAHSQ